MFALSWDIQELTQLTSEGRTLRADMAVALDLLSSRDTDIYEVNLPRKLGTIRSRCADMLRRTTRFRCKAATHVFVQMIRAELRNKKPYALPVQCLPYSGLMEGDIHRVVSKLVEAMVAQNMNVAGIVLFYIAEVLHV